MFKGSNFRGKRACVLGGGKSGMAAAELLSKKGFKVLISEEKEIKISALDLPKNTTAETGGHTDKIWECGFIVKSPGIMPSNHILKEAKKRGVPVFSETEVSVSYLPASCKIFAITGTNGKTTTTLLLTEILKTFVEKENKGRRVFTVGNIGDPLANYIGEIKPKDLIVMEVSSYQLEDSTYFKPYAAALLNITPDHLDHHGSLKKYIEAKCKIFESQQEGDIAIINSMDKNCTKAVAASKANVYGFATKPMHEVRAHVFYDGDEIIFNTGEHLKPPKLPGIHNIENAMAASLMALKFGVSKEVLQQAFNTFRGAAHRIEIFLKKDGLTFIDDSKATNVDSTVTALKAVGEANPGKVFLILGGRDKCAPYTPLLPLLEKYCKTVLTVGEAADKIKKELSSFKQIINCENIENTVKYFLQKAKEGDILLLSPACASFDQFKNFEARGKYFKKICRGLTK
ncbi:UDP-N-acetylmuramoylalanine--D-glutamate ligase [Elusimicrobium posterum]|uniref:UDP-N-acetylmuramoyl-L-alanine--D-glutamate ligase n=1 Tax=Elusimicrobium posterum TaxID=3116653 RepID=UPI003C765031